MFLGHGRATGDISTKFEAVHATEPPPFHASGREQHQLLLRTLISSRRHARPFQRGVEWAACRLFVHRGGPGEEPNRASRATQDSTDQRALFTPHPFSLHHVSPTQSPTMRTKCKAVHKPSLKPRVLSTAHGPTRRPLPLHFLKVLMRIASGLERRSNGSTNHHKSIRCPHIFLPDPRAHRLQDGIVELQVPNAHRLLHCLRIRFRVSLI